MIGLHIKSESQTIPKRLIYFAGHPALSFSDDNNGVNTENKIITRVCADYQTVNGLVNWATGNWFPLECASRTLSNLYNLHACRGIINNDRQLDLESSMSGPHHYLGHIDPRDYISIHIPQIQQKSFDAQSDTSNDTTSSQIDYGLPIYTSYSINGGSDVLAQQQITDVEHRIKLKTKIPADKIVTLNDYKWISGKDISYRNRKQYGYHKNIIDNSNTDKILINTDTGLESDSLFPNPGILELGVSEIQLQIINPDPKTNGGYEYDFSGFGAQLVPNSQPWQFNQVGIQANQHAQHKLRLITYYYGSRYVPDYLMRPSRHPQGQGSGLFIERHEFIQAITPINHDCGGFVILGQELETWTGRKVGLELIGVRIPFGYTLLVEPWAIHGDSNLTGLYSMAMTGNHKAMATADTVFLKNHNTCGNVRVVDAGSPDANKTVADTRQPSGAQKLLMTSNHMSSDILEKCDKELKNEIRCSISWLESWYYNPIIFAPQLGKKILATLSNII